MNLYTFSLFAFSFGVSLIGVLIYVRRQGRVELRYLLFSIAVFGWGLPHALWTSQNYSYEMSLALTRGAYFFANFIPITWFHFVCEYLKQKEPFRYFILMTYMITISITLLVPTDYFISGMHPIMGLKYYTTPGPFFHVYTALFFILVPLGFYYLLRAYAAAEPEQKGQLKYFLAATIVGFVCGSAMFPPTYKIPFPMILLIGMPLYPFLMGVVLVRYSMFDLEKIADAFQREKLAAIGTLTASINHEIKNPLYVAKGLVDSHLSNLNEKFYASETEELEKSRQMARKVADATGRAMEIMRRFSGFAKRKVAQEAVPVKVNLKEVLSNVLSLTQHQLELDKIHLKSKLPADLSSVKADRGHLEEILFNIILNASQSMPNGGPLSIHVSEADSRIQIKIQDSGAGMSLKQINQIFTPFYTTKSEGTGLGLYITKQLVEKNEGTISIKSAKGKGTTVTLVFHSV